MDSRWVERDRASGWGAPGCAAGAAWDGGGGARGGGAKREAMEVREVDWRMVVGPLEGEEVAEGRGEAETETGGGGWRERAGGGSPARGGPVQVREWW